MNCSTELIQSPCEFMIAASDLSEGKLVIAGIPIGDQDAVELHFFAVNFLNVPTQFCGLTISLADRSEAAEIGGKYCSTMDHLRLYKLEVSNGGCYFVGCAALNIKIVRQ